MELGTGLALLGSAQLVEKLLGPTAEYIGVGIKEWTERRVNNVKDIFKSAINNLGDKINSAGSVSPKILKAIISDGSFCDDVLSKEYFGGVLASSRLSGDNDDRGATYLAQISRMSSYQLKCHYILYHLYRRMFIGKGDIVSDLDNKIVPAIFIPVKSFIASMDLSDANLVRWNKIVSHTFIGLQREFLIDEDWAVSGIRVSRHAIPQGLNTGAGVEYEPSSHGVDLFMWAHGKGDLDVHDYINADVAFEVVNGVNIPTDSVIIPSII